MADVLGMICSAFVSEPADVRVRRGQQLRGKLPPALAGRSRLKTSFAKVEELSRKTLSHLRVDPLFEANPRIADRPPHPKKRRRVLRIYEAKLLEVRLRDPQDLGGAARVNAVFHLTHQALLW
jgi:hypothetical protein